MAEVEDGYGLDDAPPVSEAPALAWQQPPELPLIAPDTAVCLQCGYPIRGLDTSRNCPECGAPIQRSLMGNLLEFSSTEYVSSLHRGVMLILIATIAQIVVGILAFIVIIMIALSAFSGANPPVNMPKLEVWLGVLMLPFTAMLLWGWWLFSMPDPAIRVGEKGQTPRMLIRVTVIVMAVFTVLDLLVATLTLSTGAIVLANSVAILVGIAGVVQFFASVLYVRWLAPRIPDGKLFEQAKRYLWLLPLIYILGACLILGPIVASIMYLVMLNTVRVRLAEIMQKQPAL